MPGHLEGAISSAVRHYNHWRAVCHPVTTSKHTLLACGKVFRLDAGLHEHRDDKHGPVLTHYMGVKRQVFIRKFKKKTKPYCYTSTDNMQEGTGQGKLLEDPNTGRNSLR